MPDRVKATLESEYLTFLEMIGCITYFFGFKYLWFANFNKMEESAFFDYVLWVFDILFSKILKKYFIIWYEMCNTANHFPEG